MKNPLNVLLIGLKHPSKMVAYWLHKAGINPHIGNVFSLFRPKKYRIVHFVYSPTIKIRGPILLLFLKVLKKKVLVHWVGSDVMGLLTKRKMQILNSISKRFVDKHLTVAPWLYRELKYMGVESTVVPLLPNIEANVSRLPDDFSFLFYLPEKRYDFYGGKILERLAVDLPEAKFLVVANTGKKYGKRRNVKFLGHVPYREMSKLYRKVRGLIRLPFHDGLSMMVIEALLHGRYVIYSKKLKCCFYAKNYNDVKDYVKKIMEVDEPNYEGVQFAQQFISYSIRQLLSVYSELLGDLN
ncbi:MAG: hypothetical protein ACTSXW_05235 [Candidatus Baldrarchaeia archaeon]